MSFPLTPHTVRLPRRLLLASGALPLLAACGWRKETLPSTPATSPAPQPSSVSTPVAGRSLTSPTGAPPTDSLLDGWTLEQKVGQLLMVGVSATGQASALEEAIGTFHVGNVFLAGRSTAGARHTRALVDDLRALVSTDSTHDTPLLVATDQEGGQVQVLSGPGFSEIPAAIEQSGSDRDSLVTHCQTWAQELTEAGVRMNLGPVADLVDGPSPRSNGPIGRWGREYGHDTQTVVSQAGAVVEGMWASGVLPTIKHFPGLGRVEGNTDDTAEVVDHQTTGSQDAAVEVFAQLIAQGAPAVMMSSAVYEQIDATTPAVFSSPVVTGLLREGLGFTGLIMTDDVSAAAQVLAWEPGERAVMALRAGVDLVLASADPSVAATMAQAVVAEAQADDEFAARVEQSAARIVELKASMAL